MTGYSGKPLAAKLGLKGGMVLGTVHAPKEYPELLAPLPDGARLRSGVHGGVDIVHHFTRKRAELAGALRSYRKRLAADVPVWVSWPKKSAGLPTGVTEGIIRELALPLGYVDIKVCAVSDTWSGLKLVVRRELR